MESGLNARRHVQFLLRSIDGVHGVAERAVGSQIEGESDHRKLALVIEGKGGGARIETREGAERNLRAIGGFHVNVLKRIGILLKLRVDFHDDVILVELRKNRGDLALAEGVVERVVNVGRKNTEARRGVTVDGDGSDQTLVQLVAGDVTQLGQRFQLVDEARSPVSEFLGVHVFEAVLELRAADAIFDSQVLNRLEEKRDAIDLGEFGLQPADDIGGADFALGERPEIDLDAPAVQCGVCAVDADKRREALDRRVLENYISESLLALRHGHKRNILWAFGNAQNDAGILNGEKSFGNVNVEKNGPDESGDGNDESRSAEAKHELQRPAIECDDGIECIFGLAVEPAFLFFFLMA